MKMLKPSYTMKISIYSACTVALLAIGTKASAQSQAIKDGIKATDNEMFEKATSMFKAIISKEPNNAEAYYYLGENLLNAGKVDSAYAVFQKGKELNEAMPLNAIGIGRVWNIKGNAKEAVSSIEMVFNRFNEKGFKVKDEMKIRAYVEAAEAMLDGANKNTTKALDYASKAIAIDEYNSSAYIVKGDALYESDPLNATDPLNNYKKAAELDKTSAKALSKGAFMYYRGRLFEKAISMYTDALKNDPNFAPAYAGRGDANYYANKPNEAIADYKKYLELNKGNLTARKKYAWFLYIQKKNDESLAEVSAIEKVIGTDDPMTNRLKGYNLYEKGDFEGAKKCIELFLEKGAQDKINSTDYEYMGRIAMKLNDEEKMSFYFNKAVTMDYKNKSGIVAELITYFDGKKNYKMVAFWYSRKIALGSKDVNDYYYWGTNAYNADMYGACDTAFTAYVKVMPDFAPAWLYIARSKDALDNGDVKTWAAKEAYVTYISKVKADEVEKYKTKLAEAYYYMARYYYLSSSKDVAMAKCYLNKMVALAASDDWTKRANDLLTQPEIKSATAAAECK